MSERERPKDRNAEPEDPAGELSHSGAATERIGGTWTQKLGGLPL